MIKLTNLNDDDYFRFAYVEFVDKESVENALKLDDTTFKGRQLKVTN
jgi:RNA recognition motif-containing protein